MKDNSLVPANEIWYTTTDGKPLEIGGFSQKMVSNIYKEGKGVIVFTEPIATIAWDDNSFTYRSAFLRCANLQEVVIPKGVISIGEGAFLGCSSLGVVHLPIGVSKFVCKYEHPFKDCDNLKAIYVPKNRVEYYKRRFPSDMHWLIADDRYSFEFC